MWQEIPCTLYWTAFIVADFIHIKRLHLTPIENPPTCLPSLIKIGGSVKTPSNELLCTHAHAWSKENFALESMVVVRMPSSHPFSFVRHKDRILRRSHKDSGQNSFLPWSLLNAHFVFRKETFPSSSRNDYFSSLCGRWSVCYQSSRYDYNVCLFGIYYAVCTLCFIFNRHDYQFNGLCWWKYKLILLPLALWPLFIPYNIHIYIGILFSILLGKILMNNW